MAGMRRSSAVRRGAESTRGGLGRGTVGTRGGVGRITAMVIGLAVVLLLAAGGEARAGTYRVAQCGWGVGADLDSTFAATEGTAFSFDAAACVPPPGAGPAGMRFEGGVAPDGVIGAARARWVAPPGTNFIAARLTWSGTLQAAYWAGLVADMGSEARLLVGAYTSMPSTLVDLRMDGTTWAFEAFLRCLFDGPLVHCIRSTPSTMRLSGLTLVLEDRRPPEARLVGALSRDGWQRGTAMLELEASDVGAGVVLETATIDGAPIVSAAPACAVATIEGQAQATRLQPCPATAARSVDVDTTRLADGSHALRGCAIDFSGGQGCAADAELQIDNSPPAISFAAAAEGEIAATVSDRYSGPAAGTISVRRAAVDAWTDLPTTLDPEGDGVATLTARLPDLSAGVWFFRAVAADAAGNAGAAQLRVAGSVAALRQQAAGGHGKGSGPHGAGAAPRRRATHLTARLAGGSALTVDYGTAVELRGRLTDAHGTGVAVRPVAVGVRAAAGIGAPVRRRVVTDREGRFGLRLPPGTSRHVTVAFHGGGGLAPARERSLTLRVRAGVSLTAEPIELPTGESVHLRGRVRLGPARVSGRGKQVAIQYLERATKRWRPALVVRTDAAGRFDTSYRFRYVTGVARIRLRATAPAEGGWPFARGSSSPVTITVRGG
jgi:hypothetical protein